MKLQGFRVIVPNMPELFYMAQYTSYQYLFIPYSVDYTFLSMSKMHVNFSILSAV